MRKLKYCKKRFKTTMKKTKNSSQRTKVFPGKISHICVWLKCTSVKSELGISPFRQNRKNYIFHVRPIRGPNNSNLKYKLVEDTIRRFLFTWLKINWIGFLRRCKFWPVVFLWSNLWRRDSWDDSVRICTIKFTQHPIVTNW